MIKCPECGSSFLYKDGFRYTIEGQIQRYLCRSCGFRFSEPKVEFNIRCKVSKTLDPIDNSHKGRVLSSSRTVQESANGLSFLLSEDVCSHNLSSVAKGLNALPLYSSNAKYASKKMKNLSATETKTVAGDINDRVLQYAWQSKKKGLKDTTIKGRVLRLNALRKKGANLDDSNSVETVLATEEWTPANKWHYVQAYAAYTKIMNIQWTKIKVQYEPKQQYTPTRSEVEALISGCGRETATFLQALADTGARCGEMAKLEYPEVDVANLRLYINKPEKGSKSRVMTVSERTIAMIMKLSRKHEPYVFNPRVRSLQSVFARTRERVAEKLQMPNLRNIHFHSMRRFFADQLYKSSRFNTRKVQAKLGHKRLSSTEKYFGDFDADTCTYETARAETIEQAETLRQLGYEPYDTFIENGKAIKLYSRLT